MSVPLAPLCGFLGERKLASIAFPSESVGRFGLRQTNLLGSFDSALAGQLLSFFLLSLIFCCNVSGLFCFLFELFFRVADPGWGVEDWDVSSVLWF